MRAPADLPLSGDYRWGLWTRMRSGWGQVVHAFVSVCMWGVVHTRPRNICLPLWAITKAGVLGQQVAWRQPI